MPYNYTVPVPKAQLTPTFESKTVLAKAAKVDFAAGSGGATATNYPLGIVLPKGSQVVMCQISVTTAVSGGTISAASFLVKSRTIGVQNVSNVFTTGSYTSLGSLLSLNANTLAETDQNLLYELTLTGTGPATAGVIWVTVFYVV